jgi:hypothetical protein
MYSYSSANEFMECYNDNKLSEFNKRLYEDYVECNFNDLDFNNEFIDIKYKDGCNCNIKTDDNYDFKCCDDDINYYDDKFMHNKIPMFPKNAKCQQYYDEIFPKRIFDNKIFYYLPKDCKYVFTRYIDETITDTFDIQRAISYYYINDKVVLIKDAMSGWFGYMFNNYHMPESNFFLKYIDKLNNHIFKDEDCVIRIINKD